MEAEFEARLSRPRVSVVLVNRDGVDSLWHCLFALKTQTYHPEEVILVDLASQDASLSFVRSNYPKVKVLECPADFGATLAANLGAKYAQGELVAILSTAAVPTPEWLAKLVEDFRRAWPATGALASRLGRGEEEGGQVTLNFLGNPVEGFFEDPQAVFYPKAGAVLYARFLAPEGPFDEDYQSAQEDVYLGWRLRFLGKGILRSSSAKAYLKQEDSPSGAAAWKSSYLGLRNRWLNLLLFYGTGTLLKVLPWMALEALWLLLKGLGSLRLLLGVLFAAGWILLHPGVILRKRRVLQEKRKVKDEKVLRFVSGRVFSDRSPLARPLNFISLLYCLALGLKVMEFPEDY